MLKTDTKAVVFVGHAETDKPIASLLKETIDRLLHKKVSVFVSSVPGVIGVGKDWLDEIETNLATAKIAIPIMTPTSITRPWIWFELGASWFKMRDGNLLILPACVAELNKDQLPEPLGRLQAVSFGNREETVVFFDTICKEFGVEMDSKDEVDFFLSNLPKYSELKVDPADSKPSVSLSPYEHYSDKELKLVLQEHLIAEHQKHSDFHRRPFVNASVVMGKLIHYEQLDVELRLPIGTSNRLLKDAMKECGLIPDEVGEHTITFQPGHRLRWRMRLNSWTGI